MTEGQIQEEWFGVRNNGEFQITEFEFSGSNYTYLDTQVMEHRAANEHVGIVVSITR